jgi:hypothetical protein
MAPQLPGRQRSGGEQLKLRLGKMFKRSHLDQGLGTALGACHPSYVRNTNRKIRVQAGLGVKGDPISKITNVERAGE